MGYKNSRLFRGVVMEMSKIHVELAAVRMEDESCADSR